MFLEKPDGVHDPGEGPLLIAKIIVGFGLCPVQAEGYHLDAGIPDLLAGFFIYQGAVGRQTHAEAFCRAVSGDIEDILAQQRFASGQDQHGAWRRRRCHP
jgi:hypothetical protein